MKIPYGKQHISRSDIDAVTDVLKSDYLTQGPRVPEFESVVSEYVSSAYGVAVNSATSALHVACLALEVGPGDTVWTSPLTFVASANCALYCGASIDFVDIEPDTGNICVESLQEKLENAKNRNSLPKVVIPVHFAGHSCEMEKIHDLSKEYGFRIIEDASHAIGGSYKGDQVGNCCWSDITVFSFHPVKIITTGEGGMAMTNDPALYLKMSQLRTHGITRDTSLMTEESHGDWYYEQTELGYNYRMTDIQAALGISQMMEIDNFINKRRAIVSVYNTRLSSLPLLLPVEKAYAKSSYHLYVIRLKDSAFRKELFSGLRNAGIGAQVHYIPVHTQPYYRKLGFSKGDFPNAEAFYESCLSLPVYPALGEGDLEEVIEVTRRLLL